MAELERRLEALEAKATPAAPVALAATSPLGLVERLRERGGGLAYVGAAELAGREYVWAKQHDLDALVEGDWSAAAPVLGSLGSPARLALLATLVAAPRNRAELQDALGESSTGQLYHHLRDLQAAGLIHQPRRGRYEIAAHTVIPLLTILAAAGDIGGGGVEP
jgi:DNA-binding transcriptional ArsR family regulator